MDLKVANKKAEKNASMKSCSDCHTTKTPLWRGGPAGPKSLCNACGIKYNKKRRQQLGLDTGTGRNCRKKKRSIISRRRSNEVREILKMRLMAFGSSSSSSDVSGSKLREEERAALLLMALSCGSSFCLGL